MVNILTGTAFDAPKRLNHREDEGALEFPSSAGSRARGLLALKACNWRARGWTNPYITDGLVAMWDGEWNAGFGIHNPLATTIKDLIGTNDLILAPTSQIRPNSFTVESENGCVTKNVVSPNDVVTIEIVATLTGSRLGGYGALPGFIGGLSWNNSPFAQIRPTRLDNVTSWQNIDCYSLKFIYSDSDMDRIVLDDLGAFRSLSFSRDVLSETPIYDAYLDGEMKFTSRKSTPSSGTLSTSKLSFIANSVLGSCSMGEVKTIRVYNRRLTADEVKQNFLVDDVRFGIVDHDMSNPYQTSDSALEMMFDGIWNDGVVGRNNPNPTSWVPIKGATVGTGNVLYGGNCYKVGDTPAQIAFKQSYRCFGLFEKSHPVTVEICMKANYADQVESSQIAFLGSWCYRIGFYYGYSRWILGFNMYSDAGRAFANGNLDFKGTICAAADTGKTPIIVNSGIPIEYDSGKYGSRVEGSTEQRRASAFMPIEPGTEGFSRNITIYGFRLYNRLLSNEEMLNHIAIDKARFGLT